MCVKIDTLKSSKDISYIFDNSKKLNSKYISFFIYFCEHDLNGRVAFIAGKKFGNSVWRNQSRRRMREVYKDLNITDDKIVILMVAKSNILNVAYDKVVEESKRSLKGFFDFYND